MSYFIYLILEYYLDSLASYVFAFYILTFYILMSYILRLYAYSLNAKTSYRFTAHLPYLALIIAKNSANDQLSGNVCSTINLNQKQAVFFP